MSDAVLRGNLGAFTVADVQMLLAMGRKSGTLILTNGDVTATSTFADGSVVQVSPNLSEALLWTAGTFEFIEVQDDTMRQTAPIFHSEVTVRDEEVSDATSVLVREEQAVVAQLVIANGQEDARTVPLAESEYLIGRHRDNNIQLSDLGVSGFHARLFRSGDGYAIEDLKSRNGIWINGTRVFHATLRSGDTVRLGATDVRYEVMP